MRWGLGIKQLSSDKQNLWNFVKFTGEMLGLDHMGFEGQKLNVSLSPFL